MDARAVDESAEQLHALKQVEIADVGLAVAALAFAVAAAEYRPAFALPLLLGGLFIGACGMRALWRHGELVQRLARDRDAYAISEVRAFASSMATTGRRRAFAAAIRHRIRVEEGCFRNRIGPVAEELSALASELEDDELVLEPFSAAACGRLLSDFAWSPLLNEALPVEDVSSRVHQIRSGFRPRGAAAGAALPHGSPGRLAIQ
jgi:hypothetical protein